MDVEVDCYDATTMGGEFERIQTGGRSFNVSLKLSSLEYSEEQEKPMEEITVIPIEERLNLPRKLDI